MSPADGGDRYRDLLAERQAEQIERQREKWKKEGKDPKQFESRNWRQSQRFSDSRLGRSARADYYARLAQANTYVDPLNPETFPEMVSEPLSGDLARYLADYSTVSNSTADETKRRAIIPGSMDLTPGQMQDYLGYQKYMRLLEDIPEPTVDWMQPTPGQLQGLLDDVRRSTRLPEPGSWEHFRAAFAPNPYYPTAEMRMNHANLFTDTSRMGELASQTQQAYDWSRFTEAYWQWYDLLNEETKLKMSQDYNQFMANQKLANQIYENKKAAYGGLWDYHRPLANDPANPDNMAKSLASIQAAIESGINPYTGSRDPNIQKNMAALEEFEMWFNALGQEPQNRGLDVQFWTYSSPDDPILWNIRTTILKFTPNVRDMMITGTPSAITTYEQQMFPMRPAWAIDNYQDVSEWNEFASAAFNSDIAGQMLMSLPFAVAGAGAGFVAGGPPGAAVGFIIGGLASAFVIGSGEAINKELGEMDLSDSPTLQFAKELYQGSWGVAMAYLNKPAEYAEQLLGTAATWGNIGAQAISTELEMLDALRTGDLARVQELKSRIIYDVAREYVEDPLNFWKSVWDASSLFYESLAALHPKIQFANAFPLIEKAFDWVGLTDPTTKPVFPDVGQVLQINQRLPTDILPVMEQHLKYVQQMQEAGKEVNIWGGYFFLTMELVKGYKTLDQIKALAHDMYGFTGDISDLMMQEILDPWNSMLPAAQRMFYNKLPFRVDITKKIAGIVPVKWQPHLVRYQGEMVDVKKLAFDLTNKSEGILTQNEIERIILRRADPATLNDAQRKFINVEQTPTGDFVLRRITPGARFIRFAEKFSGNIINPVGWLSAFHELSPVAQVHEWMNLGIDNINEAWIRDDQTSDNRNRYYSTVKTLKDMLFGANPSQVGWMASIVQRPEWMTVKQGFVEAWDAVESYWNWFSGEYGYITKLADLSMASGISPERFVAELNKRKKKPANMYRWARKVVGANNLQMNEMQLARMQEWLSKNPYTPEAFRARLLNVLIDASANYAIRVFGVKKRNWYLRGMDRIKSIQTFFWLGYSATYWRRNIYDNTFKRMVYGVLGLELPETRKDFFENDLGFYPEGVSSGVGRADVRSTAGVLEHKLADAEGVGINEKWEKFKGSKAGWIYNPMVRLSGKMEAGASESAVYNGIKRAWGYLRKRETVRRIEGSLLDWYRSQGISIEAMYRRIESAWNVRQLEKAMTGLTRESQMRVEAVIKDTAKAHGIDEAQLKEIMAYMGLGDYINDLVKSMPHEEATIERSMEEVEDIAQRLQNMQQAAWVAGGQTPPAATPPVGPTAPPTGPTTPGVTPPAVPPAGPTAPPPVAPPAGPTAPPAVPPTGPTAPPPVTPPAGPTTPPGPGQPGQPGNTTPAQPVPDDPLDPGYSREQDAATIALGVERRILDRIEESIQQMENLELSQQAQNILTQVSGEGLSRATEAFIEFTLDNILMALRSQKEWQTVRNTGRNIADPNVRHVHYVTEDARINRMWNRHWDRQTAKLAGILQAIGFGDINGINGLSEAAGHIGEIYNEFAENWRPFYDERNIQRDLTDWNNPESVQQYYETTRPLYQQYAAKEVEILTRMKAATIALYASQYPNADISLLENIFDAWIGNVGYRSDMVMDFYDLLANESFTNFRTEDIADARAIFATSDVEAKWHEFWRIYNARAMEDFWMRSKIWGDIVADLHGGNGSAPPVDPTQPPEPPPPDDFGPDDQGPPPPDDFGPEDLGPPPPEMPPPVAGEAIGEVISPEDLPPTRLIRRLDIAHNSIVRTRSLDIVRPAEFEAYLRNIEAAYKEAVDLVNSEDYYESGASMEKASDLPSARKHLEEARRLFDQGDLARSFAHAEAALQDIHQLGYNPTETPFVVSINEVSPTTEPPMPEWPERVIDFNPPMPDVPPRDQMDQALDHIRRYENGRAVIDEHNSNVFENGEGDYPKELIGPGKKKKRRSVTEHRKRLIIQMIRFGVGKKQAEDLVDLTIMHADAMGFDRQDYLEAINIQKLPDETRLIYAERTAAKKGITLDDALAYIDRNINASFTTYRGQRHIDIFQSSVSVRTMTEEFFHMWIEDLILFGDKNPDLKAALTKLEKHLKVKDGKWTMQQLEAAAAIGQEALAGGLLMERVPASIRDVMGRFVEYLQNFIGNIRAKMIRWQTYVSGDALDAMSALFADRRAAQQIQFNLGNGFPAEKLIGDGYIFDNIGDFDLYLSQVDPKLRGNYALYDLNPDGTVKGLDQATARSLPRGSTINRFVRPGKVPGISPLTYIGIAHWNGQYVGLVPARDEVDIDWSFLRWIDTNNGRVYMLADDMMGNWVYIDANGQLQRMAKSTLQSTGDPLVVGPFYPGQVQGNGSGIFPMAQVSSDMYENMMKPIVRDIVRRIYNPDHIPVAQSWSEQMPEDVRVELDKYVAAESENLTEARMTAIRIGMMRRNAALLNYNERSTPENYIYSMLPYGFWWSHTVTNLAASTLDRPWWLAFYTRLLQYQQEVHEDESQHLENMPSRLGGMWRIPAPWLPKELGNSIFYDAMLDWMPWHQFLKPFEIARYMNSEAVEDAGNILLKWVKDGTVTIEEASEAFQLKSGPLWEQALQQANLENESNLWDYLMLHQSPNILVAAAIRHAQGKPWLASFPTLRMLQGFGSLFGDRDPMDFFGELEGAMRDRVVAAFTDIGEYMIDKAMSDMAAEMPWATEKILRQMIDKAGNFYQEAMKRVQYQLGVKDGFGALHALKRIFSKNETGSAALRDFIGAAFAGLFPGTLLPTGEMKQREAYGDYLRALEDYRAGNTEAIDDFFKAHPYVKARAALFDPPEERMRNFLVDKIKEVWYGGDLSEPEKDNFRKAFGDTFRILFEQSETNNYDLIPLDTLAGWANALGQGDRLPQTADTSSTPQVDPTDPVLIEQWNEYMDNLQNIDPEYNNHIEEMLRMPIGEREKMLRDNPKFAKALEYYHEVIIKKYVEAAGIDYYKMLQERALLDNSLRAALFEKHPWFKDAKALEGKLLGELTEEIKDWSEIKETYESMPRGDARWNYGKANGVGVIYDRLEDIYNTIEEQFEEFGSFEEINSLYRQLPDAYESWEAANPDWARAREIIDQHMDELYAIDPDWDTHYEEYYDYPESMRNLYINQTEPLFRAFEYKRQYAEENPEIADWFEQREENYRWEEASRFIQEMPPEVVYEFGIAVYADRMPTAETYSYLKQAWIREGRPYGNFEVWLRSMKYVFYLH